MKVCFVSGYWSQMTDQILGPRPLDYLYAYRYVWGVKVGSYKVPFALIYSNGTREQIDAKNFGRVRGRFGQFIEQRIEENKWEDAVLVHVPSKCAVVGEEAPRSLLMLEEAMAKTGSANSVCDGVRWTERLSAAHKGGERRRKELVPFLRVIADLDGQDVVLVDDLLTRGGTMLACRDVIEEAGGNVVGAVTCGMTMYDRDVKPYGNQSFDLIEELHDFEKLKRS